MKPYLVDVPVKINIWIREECQKKQFEIIKKARPSVLFIQSDGGRNSEEWNAINNNRRMIEENIDWECTVHKIYEDSNLGLYAMGKKRNDLIWGIVDRCIFLEDDQIPSVSYFRFCAELLEKYKDDERIECICGMNHLEKYNECSSDYFFSRQGAIWGMATWKRVADEWKDFSYGQDPYVMNLLKKGTKNNPMIWKRLKAYSHKDLYEGHVAASEFFIEFDMYAKNRLQIVPKYNLISNIGATSNASHADDFNLLPRGIRQVFGMPLYELEFPLKHPRYVIPDVIYEKRRNKIMGYNEPLVQFERTIERGWLLIKNGKIKKIFSKLSKTKTEN